MDIQVLINHLSEAEVRIIQALREMRPMEVIIIEKDLQGKPNKFFVKRIESFWLENAVIKPVKGRE